MSSTPDYYTHHSDGSEDDLPALDLSLSITLPPVLIDSTELPKKASASSSSSFSQKRSRFHPYQKDDRSLRHVDKTRNGHGTWIFISSNESKPMLFHGPCPVPEKSLTPLEVESHDHPDELYAALLVQRDREREQGQGRGRSTSDSMIDTYIPDSKLQHKMMKKKKKILKSTSTDSQGRSILITERNNGALPFLHKDAIISFLNDLFSMLKEIYKHSNNPSLDMFSHIHSAVNVTSVSTGVILLSINALELDSDFFNVPSDVNLRRKERLLGLFRLLQTFFFTGLSSFNVLHYNVRSCMIDMKIHINCLLN